MLNATLYLCFQLDKVGFRISQKMQNYYRLLKVLVVSQITENVYLEKAGICSISPNIYLQTRCDYTVEIRATEVSNETGDFLSFIPVHIYELILLLLLIMLFSL